MQTSSALLLSMLNLLVNWSSSCSWSNDSCTNIKLLLPMCHWVPLKRGVADRKLLLCSEIFSPILSYVSSLLLYLSAIIYHSEHERWIPGETKMAMRCYDNTKTGFWLFMIAASIIYSPFATDFNQTCWSSWCCKWWGDVLRIVRGRSTVFPSFGDELIMRGRIGDELTVERSIVFPEVLSPSSAGVPSWGKYVQSFWDYSFVRNCLCVLYYVTIFHSKRY